MSDILKHLKELNARKPEQDCLTLSPPTVERIIERIGYLEARELQLMRSSKRKVVCLCGSTRFFMAYRIAELDETLKGHIVLSVGFFPHAQNEAHGERVGISDQQKEELDLLHLDKIDLADEVLILNVDGYIGQSTMNELRYAREQGKKIRFLDPDAEIRRMTDELRTVQLEAAQAIAQLEEALRQADNRFEEVAIASTVLSDEVKTTTINYAPGDGTMIQLEVAYVGDIAYDAEDRCAFCHDALREQLHVAGSPVNQFFSRNRTAVDCPMCGKSS